MDSFAETSKLQSENNSTPFYQQLRMGNSRLSQNIEERSLLDHVMPELAQLNDIIASPDHEDDLAFNYLWLQSHQDGYSYRDGGSAAGKLLRMGVKALYKTHYGSSSSASPSSEEDFKSNLSDIDYRVRLSGDKVKLGIEYEF
jgi:hypothetical protein